MRKTIEKIYCDICHCENTHNDINSQKLSVIFVTEQTEGYSCNPYLSIEKLDICPNCFNKILDGNMVFAKGAQECNKYYFKGLKEEENEWGRTKGIDK